MSAHLRFALSSILSNTLRVSYLTDIYHINLIVLSAHWSVDHFFSYICLTSQWHPLQVSSYKQPSCSFFHKLSHTGSSWWGNAFLVCEPAFVVKTPPSQTFNLFEMYLVYETVRLKTDCFNVASCQHWNAHICPISLFLHELNICHSYSTLNSIFLHSSKCE